MPLFTDEKTEALRDYLMEFVSNELKYKLMSLLFQIFCHFTEVVTV